MAYASRVKMVRVAEAMGIATAVNVLVRRMERVDVPLEIMESGEHILRTLANPESLMSPCVA